LTALKVIGSTAIAEAVTSSAPTPAAAAGTTQRGRDPTTARPSRIGSSRKR
jgi:hypothetical protein